MGNSICQLIEFLATGSTCSHSHHSLVYIYTYIYYGFTATVKPYSKPNNVLKYVSIHSNHPANILNNIPKGIISRLSTISTNEEIFNNNIGPYKRALHEAGYIGELKYDLEAANKIKQEAEQIKMAMVKIYV